MLEVWQALAPGERRPWIVGAACVLLAILLALLVESLFFRGRRGAWLAVRLFSLPVAALTCAAVVLPARATSGMEGLAVFYGLLFTVAPLLWFGYHRLACRLARPALQPHEGVWLAFSGLAILAIPAAAVAFVHAGLTAAARDLSAGPHKASAGGDALPHQVAPARRFELEGIGLVFTQSLLAPPGLRLERVEVRGGVPLWNVVVGSQPTWCVEGGNVHFFWSASESATTLRLHWRAADGAGGKSEFMPRFGAAMPAVEPFTAVFDGSGVRTPVPVPRARVDLEVARADGSAYALPLGSAGTDEPDCLGGADHRPAVRGMGAPLMLAITVRPPGGTPRRALWRRDASR